MNSVNLGLAHRFVSNQIARAVGALFDPSPHVVDVAERRRARLLAMLQLPHSIHLATSAILVRATEHTPLGRVLPAVLMGAAPLVLVAYALSRTRHVRLSAWLYVVVNLAIPVMVVSRVGGASGYSPLGSVMQVVPAVLLASFLGTARAPLMTGVLGMGAIGVVGTLVGPPAWHPALRQGATFVGVVVFLTVIFNIHRDRIEADRAAELRARNQELEGLRRTLEVRVEERTAELRELNAKMRLILDNAADGLFTVDGSGAISGYSAALVRWFGEPHAAEPFYAYFGRASIAYGESAELEWDQLRDGILDPALTLDQMPNTLTVSDRHYRFSYRLIEDGADPSFLAVVSDCTNEVERERRERERQETFTLFEHLLSDKSQFVDFIDEASDFVATALQSDADRSRVRRAVHTLKGNSMIFGMQSVADICHDLESRMTESTWPNTSDFGKLTERWSELTENVRHLVGDRREVVEISLNEHAALEQAVKDRRSYEYLGRAIRDMRLEPISSRLRHFAEQAKLIAKRLEKQVEVDVDPNGVRLDGRRYTHFWAAFVHAVRNAVDHGIETPAERQANGKPPSGRLALRAHQEGAATVIEIEDDGRGINWDGVRAASAARGIRAETHDELVAALFAEGVSTSQRVTDLSGRGLGMGALLAAVKDLAGDVSVWSAGGIGTKFTARIPQMASTFASGPSASVRPPA